MKKIVGLTLDLSTKAVFLLDKYQLKIMDQTNPLAYSCSFTFHTSYKNGMIGHGGECCRNAQKHFIIKTN